MGLGVGGTGTAGRHWAAGVRRRPKNNNRPRRVAASGVPWSARARSQRSPERPPRSDGTTAEASSPPFPPSRPPYFKKIKRRTFPLLSPHPHSRPDPEGGGGRIKEPSAKHDTIIPRLGKATLNVGVEMGDSRVPSVFAEVSRSGEKEEEEEEENAQHGTKWKPSHGRRARLRGSETGKRTKAARFPPRISPPKRGGTSSPAPQTQTAAALSVDLVAVRKKNKQPTPDKIYTDRE